MDEPEGILERKVRHLASHSLGDPDVASVERALELGVAVAA
jgi:hypothetical protein